MRERLSMRRSIGLVVLLCSGLSWQSGYAQTMLIDTSNDDFEITNVVSDVDDFDFQIVIDMPLSTGLFDNPPIVSVSYRVSGNLLSLIHI